MNTSNAFMKARRMPCMSSNFCQLLPNFREIDLGYRVHQKCLGIEKHFKIN